MTATKAVLLSEMTNEEVRALLQRRHVGRLAFTLHDRVDIEPISYVVDGDWIYFRTSTGHKADVLRHHPWVAFQVDECRSDHDWESVVVHGRIESLSVDGAVGERLARQRALAAIRVLDPDAERPADPLAQRNKILRLHIDEISGRRSVSR